MMPLGSTWRHALVLGLAVLGSKVAWGSQGSSSDALRLDVPVLDVGQTVTIGVQGPPQSRYALVASRHPGSRSSRAGTWCIELSRPYFVLVDSVRGSDPTLDPAGRANLSVHIPGSASLLSTRAHFQAVARMRSAPGNWVLSRMESRTLGNGSIGDFTQEWFDLPNQNLFQSRTLSLFFDANGDGYPDLLIGGWPRCRLYMNDGTGHFTDGTAGPGTGLPDQSMPLAGFAAGDVDADGDLDLYLAGWCCIGSYTGQDMLFLNDGQGLFTDATYGTEAGLPHTGREDWEADTFDLDLGDLDGDGDLDAFLAEDRVGIGRIFINSNGRGLFIDGTDGPGTYFPRYYGCGQVRAGAVGDVDGAGDLDIVMTGFAIHRLYINTGGGVFEDGTSGASTGIPPLDGLTGADVELSDLDGDGDLDIVIAADVAFIPGQGFGPAQDRILINDGHGLFTDGTYGPGTGLPPIEDVSYAVVVGDVDRDGDSDLVFLVESVAWGDVTRLYLNDGSGSFTDSTFGPGARLTGAAEEAIEGDLGDVDRDGDLDLILVGNAPPGVSRPTRLYFNH